MHTIIRIHTPHARTEYGIDAYNDPCGWEENEDHKPCFNLPNQGIGGATAKDGFAYVGCKGAYRACICSCVYGCTMHA